MKDIKHIRRDFHSAALVKPQGWYRGGLGVSIFFSPKFNQSWCVSYLHEWHMQRHNFWGPRPLGQGPKGQLSITKSISKIFKPNFVCLLTNEGLWQGATQEAITQTGLLWDKRVHPQVDQLMALWAHSTSSIRWSSLRFSPSVIRCTPRISFRTVLSCRKTSLA